MYLEELYDEEYKKGYVEGQILSMLELAYEIDNPAEHMASRLGIPMEYVTELLEAFDKCTELAVQNGKLTKEIDFKKVHERRKLKEAMKKLGEKSE